jgi:CheY-like chemotaxis protein
MSENLREMKTTLVLDDQLSYTRALSRALRGYCQVLGAGSVADAKHMAEQDVAFALVDICLSEEDAANRGGIEFIRWLHGQHPDIQIIAMSARDDPDIPRQAKEAGADEFLPKPLRVSELKKRLIVSRERSI